MKSELLTPTHWVDYELIDSGNFEKLERFGKVITARPEPQALWRKSMSDREWEEMADAYFRKTSGSEERGEWQLKRNTPQQWRIGYHYKTTEITMRLGFTAFKHVGIFPEQSVNWDFIADTIEAQKKNGISPKILNLFAYTGGATLAARSTGADVTHVDSVKQVVTWTRENLEASGMDGVRWIIEDARKFVTKEVKRENRYTGIILDPPAYGRGADNEKWVLEKDLYELLSQCEKILDKKGFLILNLYSMGLSALLAKGVLQQIFGTKAVEFGELYVTDRFGKTLPLGVFARFSKRE